jgi:hypothetical protein
MAFAAGMALTMGNPAFADEITDSIKVGGYLRGWTSFNLQDIPDTDKNDRGDISMLRGSLLVDGDVTTGPVAWKAIVRADREYKTSYVKRLENLTKVKTPGGPGSHVMDQYNQVELREFYGDIDLGERVKLRLGKQQVVWGESDFFRAMDLIHGYDYRWRSFLEPENEELRKPLVLANAMIQIPEADGALQVIVRPGLDRDRDIGNTYDLFGGRWTPQTFIGADFLNGGATMSYDFHHPSGDVKDVTGGLRWKGNAGPVTYSLAYLRTFNPDPIINSAFAPYQKNPSSPFGNWIFPEINLVGVTASGQVPAIDSVLSTEIVYFKDAPYNVGFGTPGSNFMPAPYGTENTIPGFGGVIKKKTILSMFRLDKPLDLKSMLNTSSDTFLSFQVFDKWILNYNRADEIVDLAGYNAPKAEHSTVITGILALNFAGNTINPTLAVGIDPWNNGGFVIPSVDFVIGDNWRLKIEADLFFAANDRKPSLTSVSGLSEDKTHLFGYFANHNQLLFRVTRQF